MTPDSQPQPTKLAGWLAASHVKKSEFARRAGITSTHLSNLLAGIRGTSYATAERISTLTGGVVTIADLMRDKDVHARRRAAEAQAALRHQ